MFIGISNGLHQRTAGGAGQDPTDTAVSYGALTLAGAGGLAAPSGVTIADADGTGLVITGGYVVPASNGVTSGTVEFSNGATWTVTAVEDEISVRTTAELTPVLENATLGTTIRLRDGDYNYTGSYSRYNPIRNAQGGEVFDGTNHVTITSDTPYGARFGSLEIRGGSRVRLHQILFEYPDEIAVGGEPGVLKLSGSDHKADSIRIRRQAGNLTCESTGAQIGVNATGGSNISIVDCDISDAFKGVKIGANDAVTVGGEVRRNTFTRILEDVGSVANATGIVIEKNVSVDKLYGYTRHTVQGIAPGNPTVVTVATPSAFTGAEPATLDGLTGTISAVNTQVVQVLSTTATTVTLNINTTGLVWDGGGEAIAASQAHGDHWQFADAIMAGGQDDVVFRANTMSRGAPSDSYFGGGQMLHGGGAGARDNWLIEGNIGADCFQSGISISGLTNSIVRNNTLLRVLGLRGTNGAQTSLISVASGAGNQVYDNISNQGVTGQTGLNNVAIGLTGPNAVPPNATDLAAYTDRFVTPLTQANLDAAVSIETMFTPKVGGPLDTAIVSGAIGGAFDRSTLVWTDPRPAPNFTARGATFDGADHLYKGGLTVPGAQGGLLSVWVRNTNAVWSTPQSRVFECRVGNDIRAYLYANGSGVMSLWLATSSGWKSVNLFAGDGTTPMVVGEWYHILAAWTGGGTFTAYVNGTLDGSSAISSMLWNGINITQMGVGTNISGQLAKWDGDIAHLFFDPARTLDLSVQANREKFLLGTEAVDLGATGENPLGTAPPFYFDGVGAAWNNVGTAGSFPVTGTLAASSIPSLA